MARHPPNTRARGRPAARGRGAANVAQKKAVPDNPPVVDPAEGRETNFQTMVDSIAAVREHRATAMQPSALEWLSENVTAAFNNVASAAKKDPDRLAEIDAIRKSLLSGGWTATVIRGMGTQWTILGGTAFSSTKAEKAIGPARTVITAFLVEEEEELVGGGADDVGGGEPIADLPPPEARTWTTPSRSTPRCSRTISLIFRQAS